MKKEEIEKVITEWLESDNENTTYLAHQINDLIQQTVSVESDGVTAEEFLFSKGLPEEISFTWSDGEKRKVNMVDLLQEHNKRLLQALNKVGAECILSQENHENTLIKLQQSEEREVNLKGLSIAYHGLVNLMVSHMNKNESESKRLELICDVMNSDEYLEVISLYEDHIDQTNS